MAFLQSKVILPLLLIVASLSYGQSYNYTFTDPCTLERRSITVGNPQDNIVFNYFGQVQTFTGQQVSNGEFDTWISNVAQQFTNSPCDSVTEVIVAGINNVTTANTLTVTTNVMSVMGGGMLPPAESVNNASSGSDSNDSSSDADNNETSGNNTNQSQSENGSSKKQTNGSNTNQSGGSSNTKTNTSNKKTNSNQSSSNSNGGGNSGTAGESGSSNQSTKGGEQKTESSVESSSESGGTQSTANSVSNSIDGGAAGGGGKKKKSNKAQKQAGSLIASGDVVVISNTDNTNPGQMRFVGSITHANTTNTRIKGALFTYTTVTNNLSVTLYKSWINPKKTFNLVLANTTSTNFDNSLLNTTTALESFRFGKKKYTGMFGVNYTVGKLGERNLQNLSTVAGVHRGFKVSPRIHTSLLVLGVYSPFTQFYDGQWFDAGVLIVPFSSWDIKLTKTFKYNISFTGVYQSSGNFLNYQILTGGKLNF